MSFLVTVSSAQLVSSKSTFFAEATAGKAAIKREVNFILGSLLYFDSFRNTGNFDTPSKIKREEDILLAT